MLNLWHPVGFIGPGGPEILVVMLVLLLLFGAKDAPRIFRKLNDMLNQFRGTAENFRREVMYSDLNDQQASAGTPGDYDDYGIGSRETEDHAQEDPAEGSGAGEGAEGAGPDPDNDTGLSEGEDEDVKRV